MDRQTLLEQLTRSRQVALREQRTGQMVEGHGNAPCIAYLSRQRQILLKQRTGLAVFTLVDGYTS